MRKYLEGLNGKQREAVSADARKLLVLAGAGSGKTRVLTRRIVKHLLVDGFETSQILALTFTNKAAREMKERLSDLLREEGLENEGTVFAGTFHSFCVRVLRQHHEYAGLDKNFALLDPDGQRRVMKDVFALEYEEAKKRALEKGIPVNRIDDIFSDIKSGLRDATSKIDYLKNIGVPPAKSAEHFFEIFPANPSIGAKLYQRYELYKNEFSILDFNDLIIKTIVSLSKSEQLRAGLQSTFKAILVDEFQDTNNLQFKLISLLDSGSTMITTVGDEDQLVYEWRGAEIQNILKFPESKGVHVVKLEENYRSTAKILKAANAVIKQNEQRIGKNLWTGSEGGENITVLTTSNYKEEVDWVVSHISKLVRLGCCPSDIAILYRGNALSGPLEVGLHKNKIKYDLIGGLNFWMRKEIQAAMSFVRWAYNPNDLASIHLAMTYQKCGYGERTHGSMVVDARERGVSLEDAIRNSCAEGDGKNKVKMRKTLKIIDKLRAFNRDNVGEIIEWAVKKTDLLQVLILSEKDESKRADRLENLNTLIEMGFDFSFVDDYHRDYVPESKLEAFLQSSDLQVADAKDNGEKRVSMMTIHASKGLEFKHVVVVGMEEMVFPSYAAFKADYFEEERRLAYVAITRAMETLVLTTTGFRVGKKPPLSPSRFLDDIPRSVRDDIRPKKEKWF